MTTAGSDERATPPLVGAEGPSSPQVARPSDLHVREAVIRDVPPVVALEREVFGLDAWSEDSVTEELTGPRRQAVVVTDGDELFGYAVTLAGDGVVDLQRIAVRPDCRRRGAAGALLAELLDRTDADRMLLEVSASNEAALAFYSAEGFVQIDRRPRYYRDGSDAVVLRLALGPACGGRG